MRKKIRLTEKNLQSIVNRVIKESQLLNENLIDVECSCGSDIDDCTGNWDGETADCSCCAAGIDRMAGGYTKGGFNNSGMSTGGGRDSDKMMGMMGENRRLKLENRRLRNSRR